MPGFDPTSAPPAGSAADAPSRGCDELEMAERLQQLPAYSRSLLRIQVPVVVTLATTRRPVNNVLLMAPGTILQFSKPYDAPLTLSLGGCDVAVGETVKVGEKFGLRITSMLMPAEKFEPVRPPDRAPKSAAGN